MNGLMAVVIMLAGAVPAGTITKVHYNMGVCHVHVEGEAQSRKLESTAGECETLKALIGLSIDSITENGV